MRLTANRIAGMLRQEGYRLTPQRHAVLKVIADSHDHLTPAEIHIRIQETHPEIGIATVYRVINLLLQLKLICKVNLAGSTQSYLMRRPEEHHHHLLCSGCGRAVDFTDCDLTELESLLSKQTGFAVEGHYLEVYGKCPECCRAAARTA